MATDQDRERLAQLLLSLPVHELVDVLRRVLPHHAEESGGLRTVLVLVLATATRCQQEPVTPDVSLVGWVDRNHYDGGLGIDQGLWEEGQCPQCGIEVSSNAKRAFCPVCGSRCGLT